MQWKILYLVTIIVIFSHIHCIKTNKFVVNQTAQVREIIRYVDSTTQEPILNKLITADSLYYLHRLKNAHQAYSELESTTSGSIYNYIQFRKHETAQKINMHEVWADTIPQHSTILLSSHSKAIDTLLYYFDEINLYNEIDKSKVEQFVSKYDTDSGMPTYIKAKSYQILGEYFVYKTANPYIASGYLKLAHELYKKCTTPTHDILYLHKELIQQTVGSREYLIGRQYGVDMISVYSQQFSKDTILKALAYYMSAYADGLSLNHAEYLHKYELLFNTLEHSDLEKVKQIVYSSFVYRFKNSSYALLVDSMNKKIELSITKSDTFINVYKSLGEVLFADRQYSQAVLLLEQSKVFLTKQKRFSPGIYWTISSALIECYRQLGLYNQSDREAYNNIN